MNSAYFSYTRIIGIVALAAGCFLLYPGNLFFLNDDFTHLYLTSKGEWLQHNSFRPVCDLSMWIDYKIWGLNASGFHITNALLHLLSSYFVYVFSFKLLFKYYQNHLARSNALLIAAIFFVYCFHAETLYWIIGRSASLGTVFFLLSCIFYFDRNKQNRFLLSLVFFSIGLLAYESILILPIVFFALSWLGIKHKTSSWKVETKFILITFAVLIGYFIFKYFFIQQVVAEYEGEKFLTLDIKGLSWNWIKLILRSFSRQTGLFLLLAICFLAIFTSVLSFLFLRQKALVIALISIWLLSYIPYLSLGIDTFGSEGERYLYLPSVFLSIIIGLGIINATKSFKYIISLMFFAIQIVLLYQFRKEYEVASAVTKATTEELKQLSNQTIYIHQLPEKNNGALIFRTGIEEAAKLYTPSQNRSLQVLSIYKGSYLFFNGVSEQEWIDGLPGIQGKDAVLDFSNSSLTIYR